MNTAEQVAINIEQRLKSGIPLSDAVWETALDCVGWPYVYSAWGAECTTAERIKRNGNSKTPKSPHETIITACQALNGTKSNCDGCKWFPGGKRVRCFDCRGFTDWVLKQLKVIDLWGDTVGVQWGTNSNWAASGTIDTIPDDILVCLFEKKNGKWIHTGFGYKGQSCECQCGVEHYVKRKAKWTHWAIPNGIGGDMPDYRPILKKGDKGEYVKLAQDELLSKGYDIGKWGADGAFGAATESAVKNLQKDYGLKVDGIIGPKTWEVLDRKEPVTTLYTVHIPHCTKYQAEGMINQYPGATMTQEG